MATTTEPSRPGRSVGTATEFTLFFRIKPGHAAPLRNALEQLQSTPGYLPGDYRMPITSIHEARFALFDDDTRLLFATSFDGAWDAYMADFLIPGRRSSSSMRPSGTWRGMRACQTWRR